MRFRVSRFGVVHHSANDVSATGVKRELRHPVEIGDRDRSEFVTRENFVHLTRSAVSA